MPSNEQPQQQQQARGPTSGSIARASLRLITEGLNRLVAVPGAAGQQQHGSGAEENDDDFEQLLHAALEGANADRRSSLEVRLPSTLVSSKNDLQSLEFVDVSVNKLHRAKSGLHRRLLVDHTFATRDQDNAHLLRLIREREDRVGVELSRVEVRFQGLTATAHVEVGSRSMPTVTAFYRHMVEGVLAKTGMKKLDRRPLTILDDVSGVLKPGRLTLLLGPPGSGKTTLLKALAGLTVDGKDGLSLRGSITYNGEPLSAFQVRRTCAYIDQVDTHMAELTVRETLDFAARCLGTGHKAEYINELRRREKEQGITPSPEVDAYLKAAAVAGKRHSVVTDMTLRLLGLEVCADTVVGSNMIRGVSGGQRRRVTSGEMIVGPTKTLYMDEISTGLDSSTTYLIVQCLKNFTHLQSGTVLIALLQPPPEVFELFDDVMLLSEGHLVFHGPREEIAPFFATCGFAPPPRKGVADFLQEVTSVKDQGQHWRGEGPYSFVPVQSFVDAYRASPAGCASQAALEAPPLQQPSSLDPLVRTRYGLAPWPMFKALLRRELTIMTRNSFLYVFKVLQILSVAFITATLFVKPRMDHDTISDGVLMMSLLFYATIHLLVSGFSEMSITVALLPVYFRQRAAQFFPPWAFALPAVLLRIPYTMLDVSIWSIIVYFGSGLTMDGGRFWIYWTTLVMMHQWALAMFRFIATISREYEIAGNVASLAVVVASILGGFVQNKRSIHPWTVWVYWANPMTYTFLALTQNEMDGHEWNKEIEFEGEVMRLGDAVLIEHGIHPHAYWRWTGPLVLLGYTIVFTILTIIALTFMDNHGKAPPQFSEQFFSDRALAITGDSNNASAHMKRSKSSKSILSVFGLGSQAPQPPSHSASSVSSHSAAATSHTTLHMQPGQGGQQAGAGVGGGADGGAVVVSGPKMGLPFKPMFITFRDIKYSVPMPTAMEGYKEAGKLQGTSTPTLTLLHGITGSFRPGVLTALMGVSGAGKTTLMDVLAGRKTVGTITGDIRVAGFPKQQATFARVCGYVEQSDIHSPRTTVLEALQFSAMLRLHGHDKATALSFASEVMHLVELEGLRDALVGMPGTNGLSTEQRKRLTIAVELVANPSIVFMDEPTSGLDARAAAIVMRAVRNTVDTGRTVVATIHQPSIDIFEAFDELLLLKRGGRTIYSGPLGRQSTHLIQYFESIPGVTPIRDGVNPATWMLEATTIGREAALGVDFADIFDDSQLAKAADAQVVQLSQPAPGDTDLSFNDNGYAASYAGQFMALLWKNHKQYWRNPDYNAVRYLFCVVLGLLLGAIYWDMGTERGSTGAVVNLMGALVICVFFLSIGCANAVKPVVAVERPVFYREKAARMYEPFFFAVSQAVIEIPYLVLDAILFAAITYWMIGFEKDAAKFFWYLFFVFLSLTFFTYYGMMSVVMAPTFQIAVVATASFYSAWFIFAGFLITRPQMPEWWSWFYWLDPLAYVIYGLIASQLGDIHDEYVVVQGVNMTVAEYLDEQFGYQHSKIGWCAFILIAFILSFLVAIVFGYTRVNWQKR